SYVEKLRIAWGLARLRWRSSVGDIPFPEWLAENLQTPPIVKRVWGVVLTSPLNETPERIGVRYARKGFVEAFLRRPRGFEVELPSAPLERLYGQELRDWLARHRVCVRVNCAAKRLQVADARVKEVELRQGEPLIADWYLLTVPFDRLLELLPA